MFLDGTAVEWRWVVIVVLLVRVMVMGDVNPWTAVMAVNTIVVIGFFILWIVLVFW
jgi:ABC-type nickel/cobalt efflux system permease component RcnA